MKRGTSVCSFVSVYCFSKASSSYTHSLPAVLSESPEYSVIAAGHYHYLRLLTSAPVVVAFTKGYTSLVQHNIV